MKKRVYKYKLRKTAKKTLLKLLITLIVLVVDVVTYHYLGVLGSYAVKNTLGSAFICVGWFWLLAGQFMALYAMWD